jgi:hypothetical protein
MTSPQLTSNGIPSSTSPTARPRRSRPTSKIAGPLGPGAGNKEAVGSAAAASRVADSARPRVGVTAVTIDELVSWLDAAAKTRSASCC